MFAPRFSYFFLLVFKYGFKAFGSVLGLFKKVVKISMKGPFLPKIFSENYRTDPSLHIPEDRICKGVMWWSQLRALSGTIYDYIMGCWFLMAPTLQDFYRCVMSHVTRHDQPLNVVSNLK